jgi:hypothetical protein
MAAARPGWKSFETVPQRPDCWSLPIGCGMNPGRGSKSSQEVAVNDCGGRATVHTAQHLTVVHSHILVARP